MEYDLYNINYNKTLTLEDNKNIEKKLFEFIDITSCNKESNIFLNTNENQRDIYYNVIEKYVYEISKNVIYEYNKKNNKNFSIDKFYIEFWAITSDRNNLHYDKDEINKEDNVKPLISAVSYFNDNNLCPFILTDLEKDTRIEEKTCHEHLLYFPRKNTLMVFDGGKLLHGRMQLLKCEGLKNRKILPINLWLKQHSPKYKNFFSYYNHVIRYKNVNQLENNEILNCDTKLKEYRTIINIEKINKKEIVIESIFNNKYEYNRFYLELLHILAHNDDVNDYKYLNKIKKNIFNMILSYKYNNLYKIKYKLISK
jgi:hypothetical protein